MGNSLDVGDPMLNTWTLAWDVHSLITDPTSLFNANIFYPYTNDTIAFSENLLGDMLVALPIILLTGNPVLAYNTILLLSFILSALGMFLLSDHYLDDKYSAFIAGIIFAFCSFRFAHFSHLQLLTVQWIPFSLLFLDKFLHKPDNKNLALSCLFLALQVLSSWYIAFFTAATVALYFVYMAVFDASVKKTIRGHVFQVRFAIMLALLALTIMIVAIPYFNLHQEYGFIRNMGEINGLSANVADYLYMPSYNVLYNALFHSYLQGRAYCEHALFPGLMAIILSIIAFLPFSKRIFGESKIAKRDHIVKYFYLLLASMAFIISLGTPLHIFGRTLNFNMPYYYLYEYVPGFSSMRAPSRWGIIVMLSLAILSAYGLHRIIRKTTGIRKLLLVSIVMLIVIAESIYVPLAINKVATGSDIPKVYQWLQKLPSNVSVVELPIGYNGVSYDNRAEDTIYMYYSTYHWKNLVNGYSGFYPPNNLELRKYLQDFPTNESVNILKSLNVTYVIIHSKSMDNATFSEMERKIKNNFSDLPLVGEFDSDYVYAPGTWPGSELPIGSLNIYPELPLVVPANSSFTFSINIKNENNTSFISMPNEKLDVYVDNADISSRAASGRAIDISLPLTIPPNQSLSMPISVPALSHSGINNITIYVSDNLVDYNRTLKGQIEVVDHMSDSVSTKNVSAEYTDYQVPKTVVAGQKFLVNITVKNNGDVLWRAKISDPSLAGQVSIGTYWLLNGNQTWHGDRIALPCDVSPGQTVTSAQYLEAPETPGNYTLVLDLVDEKITWFSGQGIEPIKSDIIVD